MVHLLVFKLHLLNL